MAAEDPDHPNPYMFTGRRFDVEIGLYYYRARYYDPFTGRFLQTDPVGYDDGINWYAYCNNNPLGGVDPLGLKTMFDPTVYGEGSGGAVWGYFIDIDVKGYALSGVWNEAGLGEDFGIMPWNLAQYTVDGTVYFIEGDNPQPDDYVQGAPIWDLEHPPLFGSTDSYVEGELEVMSVGGVSVIVLDGVGLLDDDDKILNMIMAPWFEELMALSRWNWKVSD